VPVDTVYSIEQIRDAHARMESGHASGKLVVRTSPQPDPEAL
jgi:NADPH:quinone reductase-like Zn-dependent oxidoreductase